MQTRRRFKQASSLQFRLEIYAENLRKQADGTRSPINRARLI